MIGVRTRAAIGQSRLPGLEALHHFSFGGYQDPAHSHWGALRALNHSILAARTEMRPQPIDGVDIVTIVRKGAIAHCGSLGGSCRTIAGEVQLICPGGGITHADSNPGTTPAEYVEIRIRMDWAPERAHRKTLRFPDRSQTGNLALLASGFSEDRLALPLNAQARIYGARMPAKGRLDHPLAPGRLAYVMSLNGTIDVNGEAVGPLEGAAIADEQAVRIESGKFAEILLIDVR